LEGKISDGDKATLAAATQAVKDAKDALEKAIADNKTAADASIADLVAANATQDQKIVEAKAAADQAQTQLDELKAKFETEIAKLATKDELNGVIETINGVKADLAKLVTKEELADAVKQIEGVSASLTEINTKLADLEKNLTALTDEVKKAVGDIAELKTALQGQKAALDALSAENGAITKAQKDITSLLARVKDLEEQMDAVRNTEAGKVAQEISDIKTTLAQLQAAHSLFADKQTVSGISQNLAGVSEKVTDLESAINGVDSKINTITAALSKALRSLVYIPYLYVDGIESIEYPYLTDTAMVISTEITGTRKRTTAPYKDDNTKTVRGLYDWDIPALAADQTTNRRWVAPVHPVQYNMNPSRSNTAWGDVLGFDVRGAEVITRALGADGVNKAEKYLDGTTAFKNENGILTVGLQVAAPWNLADPTTPTEAAGRYDDNIIALQVNSKEGDDENKTITSDYAMLYPEKVTPEAIVWVLNPATGAATGINVDETCNWNAAVKNHVWDRPQEALGMVDASIVPDIKLWVDNTTGIKLEDYLGIHYVNWSKTKKNGANKPGTWNFVDANNMMKKYGLTYKFELVDYTIDGNATHDSKYCSLDEATGTIIAKNVDADGNTITTSKTAVGREPLVRVKVMQGDDVILDGYILVHITMTEETVPTEDLLVDNYPESEKAYTFCNDLEIMNTNWSQFSYYVLTQKLDNLTKEKFDAQYGDAANNIKGVPELNTTASSSLADGGITYDDVKIYKKTATGYTPVTAADYSGTLKYKYNANATTNHGFIWQMTEEELEALTHHATTFPVEVERYFRYDGFAGAKYENIYVKMVAKINRPAINDVAIAEKNKNYWFALDGNDNGFDAIVFNVDNPVDGLNTHIFTRNILSTFVGNDYVFGSLTATNKKFYFLPNEISIVAQDGNTYTISPKASATDANWNVFKCRYNLDGTEVTHTWGTEAENKDIFDKCAINYGQGVFNNQYLYIWKDGVRKATLCYLNQTAGTITLYRNDYSKLVLNAIGYAENHANINTEMRAWVGAIGYTNTCKVTDIYPNNNFLVSWQRPLNMKDNDIQVALDANTNRNYIYAVDVLKFFDYRGPVEGKMYGDTQWLWAYYEINKITIDTDPNVVTTNMHQSSPSTFVKLSDVTTQAALGVHTNATNNLVGQNYTWNFDLSSYNEAAKNSDLLAFLGITPDDATKKLNFGAIAYDNNGDNVEEFDLRIPVTVGYYWGEFTTTVQLHVNRTAGN